MTTTVRPKVSQTWLHGVGLGFRVSHVQGFGSWALGFGIQINPPGRVQGIVFLCMLSGRPDKTRFASATAVCMNLHMHVGGRLIMRESMNADVLHLHVNE